VLGLAPLASLFFMKAIMVYLGKNVILMHLVIVVVRALHCSLLIIITGIVGVVVIIPHLLATRIVLVPPILARVQLVEMVVVEVVLEQNRLIVLQPQAIVLELLFRVQMVAVLVLEQNNLVVLSLVLGLLA
jgi:hypothetical protein